MAVSLGGLGVNPDRLFHGQATPTGSVVYAAPGAGNARTKVDSAIICNPSPLPATIRLGLIPSGAAADGTHYLMADFVVGPNRTAVVALGAIMRPGDQLEGQSSPLPAPAGLGGTLSGTGGTLPATTYFYKITATNTAGETIGSNESSGIAATGTTSSIALAWARTLGATAYKIYRSTTSGAEVFLATVTGGATTSWTDTGSATAGTATPPTISTAACCIFTIVGTELPA